MNLQLIYSCVSLFGIVLLLISAPLGFAQMFTVVNEIATVIDCIVLIFFLDVFIGFRRNCCYRAT